MIRLFFTLAFITCSLKPAFAQVDSILRFVSAYGAKVSDFSVDNLGNLYLVSQSGQLKKLQPGGDSVAVFNNVRKFGRLHSIDVSNPLKVLLYYRDFSTIVILDRFLNERSTLDLRKHDLIRVNAIGQSYDNNIWIFDELELKLKKIGDDGRLIDQSNDFRLIFDSTPTPDYIIDQNKYVYLYDDEKGIYTFDYYGGFKSRTPFIGWADFRVINNSVFGRDENFLYRYDNGTLDLQKFPLPSFIKEAKKVIIAPGNVYLLKDGVIMVYSYSL